MLKYSALAIMLGLLVLTPTDSQAGCMKCRNGDCFTAAITGYDDCIDLNPGCQLTGECALAGCFIAGTTIATATGIKSIEELTVGDWVLSGVDQGATYGMVVNTYRDVTQSYYLINEFLKVTESHPFLVNGEWVTAGELAIGDMLLSQSGPVEIESLELVNRGARVYNITVDGLHTFVAGGMLVHNKNDDDPQG